MFAFKQFTIRQDRTAMKVCTDACVLGAYADVGDDTKEIRILDIGTGTGLLALMAAQRNPVARIDAIEIDEAAFGQATENVTATRTAGSTFADRIQVKHGRVQDFARALSVPPYDRILTNPPFYTNHLRSPDAAVNRALHTGELPVDDLLAAVTRLLKPDGQWWVLLPVYETDRLCELASEAGLRAFRQLQLRHNANKPVFRVITGFAFGETNMTGELLSIYEPDNQRYTPEFRALLRDFYLIF